MSEIRASHAAVGAVLAFASATTVGSAPRIYEAVPVEQRVPYLAPSITNLPTASVRELRQEDFAILTANDIAMLEAVANAHPDDLDYSDLLLSDDE